MKRKSFAEILVKKRKERGLSRKVLADKLQTYPAIIRNWEIGFCYPGFVMLCSLADIFNCSIDELAGRC